MARKKAALEFLTWATGKKAEQGYAEANGIPVREDVYQEMAKNTKFWWAKAVADSTPYIKPFPRVTAGGEIHTYLNDMLRQVVAKRQHRGADQGVRGGGRPLPLPGGARPGGTRDAGAGGGPPPSPGPGAR